MYPCKYPCNFVFSVFDANSLWIQYLSGEFTICYRNWFAIHYPFWFTRIHSKFINPFWFTRIHLKFIIFFANLELIHYFLEIFKRSFIFSADSLSWRKFIINSLSFPPIYSVMTIFPRIYYKFTYFYPNSL